MKKFILAAIGGLVLAPVLALAVTSSTLSPTDEDTVASDWNDYWSAFTSNDNYATANNDDAAQGYDEFGGFNIPSDATVNGITVEIDAKQEDSDESCQLRVRLSGNNGSSFTSNKTLTPNYPSETTLTYGGSSDMWGASWTPAMFNNANFVLVIEYNDPGSDCDTSGSSRDDIYVDHIRVTVDYTTAEDVCVAAGGTWEGQSPNDCYTLAEQETDCNATPGNIWQGTTCYTLTQQIDDCVNVDGGFWNGSSCDPIPVCSVGYVYNGGTNQCDPTPETSCKVRGDTWTGSECIRSSGGGIGISVIPWEDEDLCEYVKKNVPSGFCLKRPPGYDPNPPASSGPTVYFYNEENSGIHTKPWYQQYLALQEILKQMQAILSQVR